MDMEDQFGPHGHYFDLDGDGHAIFDIPEEVLETAQQFASENENSSTDEQYYDDGSSELDDEELYGPTKSGGDGNQRCQRVKLTSTSTCQNSQYGNSYSTRTRQREYPFLARVPEYECECEYSFK